MTLANDWLEPHPLWVVGHRGAPRRARENTLASFDFAEALGADAVEFDLQQSRDGELVIFHDDKIPIGTDLHPVREMAAGDIRSLILDSPFGQYRISALNDFLHRYSGGLRFIAEMKTTDRTNRALAAKRVADLLDSFSAVRRALVASFDADLLRRIKEHAPEIAVSFLFDGPVELPRPDVPQPQFPPCEAIGPRANLVTEEFVTRAKLAGLPVNPWTVDEPEQMQHLASLGVASLTTNDCELARRIFPR